MKYKVEITEILKRMVEVEADSEEQALTKVKQLYDNEEIVIDSNDFNTSEFELKL